MTYTFESLTEALGCEILPPQLRFYFEKAMAEYDQNGCYLADPAYFRELQDKYGCYPAYLDVFCAAAEQIAQNEVLARYLTLLGMATKDRKRFTADPFEPPLLTPQNGDPALGYEMLNGLAIAAAIPDAAQNMLDKALPENVVAQTLATMEISVREFTKHYDGRLGFHLFAWYQRTIDGILFPLKRMEIELYQKFEGLCCVFRNKNGEETQLAHGARLHKSGFVLGSQGFEDEDGAWEANITETPEYFEGHPVLPDGSVSAEIIRLDRNDWTKVISNGDPVVALHIPSSGAFTSDAIDTTVAEAREFIAKYFPEMEYNAFVCGSWLLSPQLWDILGENSNIVKFGRRFRLNPAKNGGSAVFYFVFNRPFTTDPSHEFLASLPENTSLQRVLKQKYLNGEYLLGAVGYFL